MIMKTYVYTDDGRKCIWVGDLENIPRTGEYIQITAQKGNHVAEKVVSVKYLLDYRAVFLHIESNDFDEKYPKKTPLVTGI